MQLFILGNSFKINCHISLWSFQHSSLDPSADASVIVPDRPTGDARQPVGTERPNDQETKPKKKKKKKTKVEDGEEERKKSITKVEEDIKSGLPSTGCEQGAGPGIGDGTSPAVEKKKRKKKPKEKAEGTEAKEPKTPKMPKTPKTPKTPKEPKEKKVKNSTPKVKMPKKSR